MKNKHIEIFTEYLKLLVLLIEKVELVTKADDAILHARLDADMFPLGVQVEIAASFALRSCCRIASVEVASFTRAEKSFNGLKAQLDETIKHMAMLDGLDNDLNLVIDDKAGPTSVSLKAEEFLLRFAYPNFFFHMSMVYAIARSTGIPLTKGDFDGIHQYPLGFSFENECT